MHRPQPKLTINTATQLICFLVFAIFMNQLSFKHLLVISTVLIAILVCIKSLHFFRMIQRMKWFLLVMLCIFLFNTPGQHMQSWGYLLSPTYEGLQSGLLQIFRMLALLAALSLVMTFNTKQQLISGFYFLLLPLQSLGLKIERFAARLWLTLDYVESAQQLNKRASFTEQLKAFGSAGNVQQADFSITFKMPVFKVLDVFVLCSLMLMSVYALVKVLT